MTSPGVYELWNGDQCLYIGSSVNPQRRISDHRRTKRWWSDVTSVRVIDCASTDAALNLETRLIITKRPKHNLRWNPDYDLTLLDRPMVRNLIEAAS